MWDSNATVENWMKILKEEHKAGRTEYSITSLTYTCTMSILLEMLLDTCTCSMSILLEMLLDT